MMLGGISSDDKINFARHLSIIIKAGLPLIEGLRIIRRQISSSNLNIIVDGLIEGVNSGQSLAHCLGRYPKIFDNFFVSIVAVGEISGTLAPNLLYLSEELKKGRILQGRVRSAMIYPLILFVATVSISVFLTFFIFPKIVEAFAQLNVQLPGSTLALIAMLGFVKAYWLHLLIGFVAAIILFRVLIAVPRIHRVAHYIVLRTPVLSKLVMNVSVATSARILAILLKSGVKIVEALMIVSGATSNLVYREAFAEAAEEIKKGQTLGDFLKKRQRIFPPIFSAMVEVGESTGNLEENLLYLSEYYTEEVDTSLKDLTSFMEPMLILVMGLIVGFVALSIITPIYSITQGIQK